MKTTTKLLAISCAVAGLLSPAYAQNKGTKEHGEFRHHATGSQVNYCSAPLGGCAKGIISATSSGSHCYPLNYVDPKVTDKRFFCRIN
jgi:hypothetical protein